MKNTTPLGGLAAIVFLLGAFLTNCSQPAGGEATKQVPSPVSTTSTIAGTWTNEYNSLMHLTQLSSGVFMGTYSSTTGSSGTYYVLGYSPIGQTGNQPVALSVYWRSITGGTPDPTWDWTSTMCGQLQTDAPNGLQMELLHSMIASSPYSAVDVYAPGLFTETLVFTPYSGRQENPAFTDIFADKTAANGVLSGTWVNLDPSSRFPSLQLLDYAPSPLLEGVVNGRAAAFDIAGLYDVDVRPGMLVSLALTGIYTDENNQSSAVNLGGFYNPANGQLELEAFKAIPTSYQAKYACVDVVGSEIFVKN